MEHKIKYLTLREWRYLNSVFNIRKGYETFLAEDIDKVADIYYVYNETETGPEIDLDATKVYLPRFFFKKFKHLEVDGYIGHKFAKETEIEVFSDQNYNRFKIEKFDSCMIPRTEQVEILEFVKKYKEYSGSVSGIIQAAPGFGKTSVSIKIMDLFKIRSLIVVPNELLMVQWIDAIIQFSNLKKEDIGIMQGSNLEELKKQKKEINIVIINSLYSQIQRLNRNDVYDLYSDIGIVFYDECHVAGAAESFSKTTSIFTTNNIIGLSATPHRKGLNDFLLNVSIGPVIFISDHQNLVPTIHIHNIPLVFDKKVMDKLQYFRNDYIKFLTVYNAAVVENDTYMNYLADWVNFRRYEGHKTITIFATTKACHKLAKIVKERFNIDAGIIIGEVGKKQKVEKGTLCEKSISLINKYYMDVYPKKKKIPELIVGQNYNKKVLEIIEDINLYFLKENIDEKININENIVSKSDIDLAKEKDVIFGTTQMLKAGFDDTMRGYLFVGDPIVGKVAVIQSVGRITRINPNKLQDVGAHFMWSTVFSHFFPDMHWTLIRNLKVGYPTAKFNLEGFDKIN